MNNVLKFVPKEKNSESVEQEGKLLQFPSSFKSPLELEEKAGSESFDNLEEFLNSKKVQTLPIKRKKTSQKVKPAMSEYEQLVQEFRKGMSQIDALQSKMDKLMMKIEEYHDEDDCGTLMF